MLDLAPGNTQALDGLDRVALLYGKMSEQAFARRDYDLARAYIKHGLEAYPDNPKLLQLWDRHEQQMRNRAARPVAPPPAPTPTEQFSASEEAEKPNAFKRLWRSIF
jgi:hypothetical protein